MPRFIDYNHDQMKMLAVSYDKQILPGTFESSLVYLIDQKLDVTIFHPRYKNEERDRHAISASAHDLRPGRIDWQGTICH